MLLWRSLRRETGWAAFPFAVYLLSSSGPSDPGTPVGHQIQAASPPDASLRTSRDELAQDRLSYPREVSWVTFPFPPCLPVQSCQSGQLSRNLQS